ncbi:prolipoprotein diacylglyceryl transferase [Dyadobacter sp. BE34]|uniref:Phosphatidylglycerol--prolipoprotein diacylglyceryl transferase n=1 Tax=Dyadobacter fermentans TaxID=94254 RepID=A0ABU1R865_9BACT|nr:MULTISPECIES: prolipoprotein diacylglyceryl transferase [Dyadobacter]MDR6809607.1 prolipoprotein diacylglyceryl transferase [Dyadobacter fermentans]MDR7047285.1 prolipoprotein diacylglyceryl transferase [Dyadobacter sp. BE242]MDR7201521.1 prolipoprotein diacylglyceryl transferase [Dyadobacter sp. BE34]MDR7219391.1 prolipoprotein diacylglyceryl transferase [Dyadobacter sp. BE31]MDR7267215.1 prolipoprotein diacylglyceryl transferase [Dyadobacter sp. BE32]
MLHYIIWDVRPEVFSWANVPRWYGVFWATGIFLSIYVASYIFKIEKRQRSEVDELTLYLIIGTLVGARLGHILFYEPLHYWQHPIEILPVSVTPSFHFTGLAGLASHGGGLGLIIAVFIFARRKKMGFLWLLDRIAVVVPLCGAFIRLGNLMNSEMIGIPTTMPWAFVFAQVDHLPRHPAQLYEAIYCVFLFGLVFHLWRSKRNRWGSGTLFGVTLSTLFTLRFLDEFFKINQESFENNMMLNMGQILSIPFIIVGLLIIAVRLHKPAPL